MGCIDNKFKTVKRNPLLFSSKCSHPSEPSIIPAFQEIVLSEFLISLPKKQHRSRFRNRSRAPIKVTPYAFRPLSHFDIIMKQNMSQGKFQDARRIVSAGTISIFLLSNSLCAFNRSCEKYSRHTEGSELTMHVDQAPTMETWGSLP